MKFSYTAVGLFLLWLAFLIFRWVFRTLAEIREPSRPDTSLMDTAIIQLHRQKAAEEKKLAESPLAEHPK